MKGTYRMNINYWQHNNISKWDGDEYLERFSFSMSLRASMIPNNTGQPFSTIFNNHFMKCVEFLKKKHAGTDYAEHLDKISKSELRHINNPTTENVWVDIILVDDTLISDVIDSKEDTLEMMLNGDSDSAYALMSSVSTTFDRLLTNTVMCSIYILSAKEWNNREDVHLIDPKDVFLEVS